MVIEKRGWEEKYKWEWREEETEAIKKRKYLGT